ncbi:phosphoribosylanthranilate isomerase [Pleurocapsa sp. FMAR1]|uniref:phosphoribosylanthranilate isomerase n=1 Tax=Pleurocapsa sp. FMAR1 TaxID=3040204 RepID=UPI0029C80CC7|nr:phosphoribosylanthranilate isomerase [Pleurocapsa sp. FMAR1]
MRVKICGITQIKQGQEIVALGANSLGFICVKRSPRYITPANIKAIADNLLPRVDKVGVFADHSLAEIVTVVNTANLTAVQLHGSETPDFCAQLRQALSIKIELIKAFRIKTAASLLNTKAYTDKVDTLLLDAYHPQMLGGTGKTIDWQDLKQFKPALPWMLAGGLNPDNIADALSRLQPDGIDLSSGVERSPGDKDLNKVTQLFKQLTINN